MNSLIAETEFLAVDLHVRSRRSLQPLLDAWPSAQTPGREGNAAPRWLVVNWLGPADTPDQFVRELVRAVERLAPAAKLCWTQATSRTFDIGIQGGLEPICFEGVRLNEESLRV
jgi:hypothetical protein